MNHAEHPDMLTVPCGDRVKRLLRLAHASDTSPMLHGTHGVGKSEIVEATAAEMGIRFISVDLSILEPTDLTGLPRILDGRTVYAPPDWLPRDDGSKGFLLFEELNRCPRYMRVAPLQLLTRRTLNDYRLPAGWLPIAAVNDAEDGYEVDVLDAALWHRFTHIRVEATVPAWVRWARKQSVHHSVIEFVRASPHIFDAGNSDPRSWTRVSQLVQAFERIGSAKIDDLTVMVAGQVGATWASAFLAAYQGPQTSTHPKKLAEEYRDLRPQVLAYVAKGRLDILDAAVSRLERAWKDVDFRRWVAAEDHRLSNLRQLEADIPAEFASRVSRILPPPKAQR